MPLGVDGPNGESLILYGVNLILDRPDGRYVQFMIVFLVDGREEKTLERILKSVRWSKADK